MERYRPYFRLLLAAGLGFVLVGCAMATTPAATLPVSKGVYRLPFENGTLVQISQDHIGHGPQNRLDMVGNQNIIVAAGEGVIWTIVDTYTLSQCNQTNPACGNNYVWIEHPNGEWSKYSHFQTGSVSNMNWSPGDSIQAGEPLGLQGDIGLASGPHLHFEVAVPNDPQNPLDPNNLRFGFLAPDGDGDNSYDRQNRIPIFCDGLSIPSPLDVPGLGTPVADGDIFIAFDCREPCPLEFSAGAGVDDDEVRHIQADDLVFNDSDHQVATGGGEAFRAGQRVVLNPGFHAEEGSFFSASIGACDTPGAN